ncbi:MAG: protein-methionine-sulfoxide reductase catalytic subunit MsrP [Longilinea sp.]|nr:protein-methionine-sulfoxide reductase catalytic subunit MsrP [Longilinea sp.]MCA1954287.1 protein-methionine-sulfoxide reductase catalytic subunit MsrP [Anaerolinea sp.]
MKAIPSSEITPEEVYLSRRRFLKQALVFTGAVALAACAPQSVATNPPGDDGATATGSTDELGDRLTSYQDVTNYNNFYEFTTDKVAVARLSSSFISSPWQVQVGGLVESPKTFDLDDLRTRFDRQERITRLRCVEGWSMVIPWLAFPLRDLLNEVRPTADARYVRFESLYDPQQFPGQKDKWFNWPYVEGLTLAEAYNDLTLLATGLYGKDLLPQNGAPIRLVVPWKYGFKSIKSIVKIDLVAEQPTSLWMAAAPNEYGFYANVNPNVPHPRWSQASERRIGELGRRDTLLFNGYAEQVAELYRGLDLKANY